MVADEPASLPPPPPFRLESATGPGFLHYGELSIPLSRARMRLALMVASAHGEYVSRERLWQRVSAGKDARIVDVQLWHIRRACREAGLPDPFDAPQGYGVRWRGEVEVRDVGLDTTALVPAQYRAELLRILNDPEHRTMRDAIFGTE